MELSIDTSTSSASLALSEKGKVVAEMNWHTRQNHTAELLPNLIHLLDQCKSSIRDIQAVTVAKGPGTFNGIRVGLSTAKGLSFALSIPLLGISTLEALAFPYIAFGLPVCPILAAGRKEIATALFHSRDGFVEKIAPEHISTADAVCESVTERTIFCGEIGNELSDKLESDLGDNAIIIHDSLLRIAGCLARLGWRRIESEDFDDPSTLQPLYLKRPGITVPKKRRHDAMSNMRPRGQG
ncbi:MAG: tRNA (adenosine(37)-N6)-threonylcarbamoyltransferase complex dimerization subunit type 1 TsaB [Chloroflexota bacterium]